MLADYNSAQEKTGNFYITYIFYTEYRIFTSVQQAYFENQKTFLSQQVKDFLLEVQMVDDSQDEALMRT